MPTSNFNFKTALVTGGGDGKKIIIAGRTESNLQSTSKEIGAAAYYVLDTGDIASIPAFVKKLIAEHSDIDCLVNNAGVQRPLDVNGDDPSEFAKKADQEIDINIRGPMHLALHLLKHFKSKDNALIVNVSSVLGFVPFSVVNPVYCGTKAWMHFWSMDLRAQLKGSNVKVVEIAPPTVATDLHRERSNPDDNKKENNKEAMSVEEFTGEVMAKWKEGVEMIAAGPANKIVNAWTENMGPFFDQRVNIQHHDTADTQTCAPTMAPRNAIANISFTVDSASEDDMTHDELNALPTPESNAENKAPTRKARGKAAPMKAMAPAIKAPAKGRPVSRRASGGSVLGVKKTNAAVAKKAPAKAGRKALAERKDFNGSDTEEVDEFDEQEEVAPAKTTKRGRPAKEQKPEEDVAQVAAPAKRGRKPATKELAEKKEPKSKTTARSKTTKRAAAAHEEPEPMTIPETQPEPDLDPMDVEDSIEVDEIPESMPPPPRPTARRAQAQPSRARQTSAGARRAGSASDSERDPALRRKVGDLTRKLESMTVKYETLKEAATSGKESNFDQLKKRTEQTAKDQDAVIKALKQQISELQNRTSDITSLKRELAAMSKENARLSAENKKATDSLTAAQNESKMLSNKLAAARSSVQPETKNVPGSAVKSRTNGVVLPGTAEAAKEATLAKQKVDLYSDLTNLVILGMKRNDEDEDVYDCLQTGRNGTLHFHLTVAAGTESYEDTEFVYQPLLNQQRDRELLDLLPDYLTEEICFPRGQAAKFYCKVVDSMSKKIILEEE
ncbi:hypothetical protein FB567DRAFT_564679 [Paraphoma chrysanthemicola]|uniref:Monopolin complex subunit Csm1/Pcs1 C-terminal domain-containing protein n=1 Tax=Paraphoma chrysanthemicola TaxID=798071 RepID=A0A8K0QTJ1_9PLEO|nr:hypothetical protein FB567DRAFT_564679 [Paraphoma chrysanthemicola]